ncbi:hypothetical protein AcV7_006542 [Taiwanofungus camphoratus]|nr:hypothetical protein AcV7_006542 [Antrodia cinnamomea]
MRYNIQVDDSGDEACPRSLPYDIAALTTSPPKHKGCSSSNVDTLQDIATSPPEYCKMAAIQCASVMAWQRQPSLADLTTACPFASCEVPYRVSITALHGLKNADDMTGPLYCHCPIDLRE